ncbi:cell wall protein [Plectosphaerella plurivora]|uniref:Cell wall protein n=1 Tax=Plectosphaerella plurivora TaxID=936078 RepID=A0A9P9AE87_9PEZI|nr:cell wall protein [Plectosphaerella plurivora]
MKFSASFALAAFAIGSAVADNTIADNSAALAERDLQTVTSVITNVQTGMRNLNQALQSFNGDPAALSRSASELVNTLRQGATAVQGTTELTIQEAVNLQQSVGGLQSEGQTLVRNLEAQKPRLQQANLCDVVRQQVGQVNQGAGQLITAVVGKVPEGVRQIAQQMTQAFTQVLAQTEQSFSAQRCVNGQASGNSTNLPGSGTGNNGGNGQAINQPGRAAASALSAGLGGIVAAAVFACLML